MNSTFFFRSSRQLSYTSSFGKYSISEFLLRMYVRKPAFPTLNMSPGLKAEHAVVLVGLTEQELYNGSPLICGPPHQSVGSTSMQTPSRRHGIAHLLSPVHRCPSPQSVSTTQSLNTGSGVTTSVLRQYVWSALHFVPTGQVVGSATGSSPPQAKMMTARKETERVANVMTCSLGKGMGIPGWKETTTIASFSPRIIVKFCYFSLKSNTEL